MTAPQPLAARHGAAQNGAAGVTPALAKSWNRFVGTLAAQIGAQRSDAESYTQPATQACFAAGTDILTIRIGGEDVAVSLGTDITAQLCAGDEFGEMRYTRIVLPVTGHVDVQPVVKAINAWLAARPALSVKTTPAGSRPEPESF